MGRACTPFSLAGAKCRRQQAGANKGGVAMGVKHLALGLAVMVAAPAAVTTAQAAEGNFVPLFSYRTGPYSGAGIAIFNGLGDYLTMLNERGGGIGGGPIIVEEWGTGDASE